MAIQTYTPDVVTTTGTVPTKREGLSAADTFTFATNGKQRMRFTAGTTECKIKVKFQSGVDGVKPLEREIVIKENSKYLGPFEYGAYATAEGKVEFTLSATTNVVIEIFE